MYISYKYQEKLYLLLASWTEADGKSTVFRDVTQKVADRHGFDAGEYLELAEHLDALTDKLYGQIYRFIDEYEAVPFAPRFRRIILKSLAAIIACVKEIEVLVQPEREQLLAILFMDVADKLRDIVNVYLEERAYQSKFRERLRDKEQYIEMTPPAQLSCEFEDVLLQMTDLSRQMGCLSETQRRRLVQHVFLNYTFQEIADSEHVTKQSVHESIITALKIIKSKIE